MKRIAILPTIRKEKDMEYTKQTIACFLKHDAKVWMEDSFSKEAYAAGASFASAEDVYRQCELIVVLGGDGSILRAAQIALRYNIPLLGINLGRLGYMAELEKDEIPMLETIYTGKYCVEERMTLSVAIQTVSGEQIPLGIALNDVVIGRGAYARSIDMDLRADDKPVRTIRADGIVLATPTGSTAYSMAAGGGILDPTLSCICATPIAPISRYALPTVFSGNSVLEIVHSDDRAECWTVNVDGEDVRPLYNGERLIVRRAEALIQMISLKNEGFFEILNNKISKYELKN